MKFENTYGYFSDDGKEYHITTPLTPKPWGNVISNGDYGLMISQTGSGYSWRGNAIQNRITRSFQDLVKDNWGKYFYIRDINRGKYWSATYKPVMHEYEQFEVIHGIGYSRFRQKIEAVQSELTIFVTARDPVEVIQLKLTNLGPDRRELDVTSYVEWLLGFAPDEQREFHKLFIETWVDVKRSTAYANKCLWAIPDNIGYPNNEDWPYTAFLAVSEPLKSFDCDKETFLGKYRNDDKPRAMDIDRLSGHTGRYTDPIAALQVAVPLEPKESKTVVFTLGVVEEGKEIPAELVRRYVGVKDSELALREVNNFWSGFIEAEKVETPDEALNIMTNTWLKYQAISCRLWGKSAFYQANAGYGFKDQLHDSLIFLTSQPGYTRQHLLINASKQFIEGDVLHGWFSLRGGDSRTDCSDDLLWLPFILVEYLTETSDFTILEEMVLYLNGPADSLYNHCKKAIERSFSHFSPRGLPMKGPHEWNDGLNAVSSTWKGESFWVAEFLYMVLGSFIHIARRQGDSAFVDRCEGVRESLRISFNRWGWDGDWFIHTAMDDGSLLGSKVNKEGKIFLMPNIWAVISGIAGEDRGKQAMEAVTRYLLNDYGTLLNFPAFTSPKSDIGLMTRYAPGLRENGGVDTHAAAWSVWAFTLVNQPEKAYEAYQKICPPNRSLDMDVYQAEPYVTAGSIDGPLSEYYGRGGWTWYSGSAQWLHYVATHWILGIRPHPDGLWIEPAIPSNWDGYSVRRKFRQAQYVIEVKNPEHVNKGVKTLLVDGFAQPGNLVPPFEDGLVHRVEVIMGK